MNQKLKIAAGIAGFLGAWAATYMIGDAIRDEWFGGVPPRGWTFRTFFWLTGIFLLVSFFSLLKHSWGNGRRHRVIICLSWCGLALSMILNRIVTNPELQF